MSAESRTPSVPQGMEKLMVCGSRGWYSRSIIRGWIVTARPQTILHGGAEGADSIAEEIAQEFGITSYVFKPDYKSFGKEAPHVRNDEMLKQADFVLAFWDGKSRGTKSVIDKADKWAIPHKVVTYGL